MEFLEFQSGIRKWVEACRGYLPEADILSMIELTEVGEPGVAVENLWVQRCEYGIHLPIEVVRELQILCAAVGIKPSYWHRLSPMRLWCDGQEVSPQLITYNSGLNYGQRRGVEAGLHEVRLSVDREELVHRFSAAYAEVSEELRLDDEIHQDDSPFKALGYVSLAAAFDFPKELESALTYFDREIFSIYIGHLESATYCLNGTNRIEVSPEGVTFVGTAVRTVANVK